MPLLAPTTARGGGDDDDDDAAAVGADGVEVGSPAARRRRARRAARAVRSGRRAAAIHLRQGRPASWGGPAARRRSPLRADGEPRVAHRVARCRGCVLRVDALDALGGGDARWSCTRGATASTDWATATTKIPTAPRPTFPAPPSSTSRAALGTLALLSTGSVYAWGNGAHGRLGLGDANDRSSPTVVLLDAAGVRAVYAGASHSMAVAGGAAYSWGKNNQGQCGHGTTTDVSRRGVEALVDADADERAGVARQAAGAHARPRRGRLDLRGARATTTRAAKLPPVLPRLHRARAARAAGAV